MTPKEYRTEFRVEFDRDDEKVRYIRIGLDALGDQTSRIMIQYEIEYQGQTFTLVRYDNGHGALHVHSPGSPMPSPERNEIRDMPLDEFVVYAINEIKRRYPEWEAWVKTAGVRHTADPDDV